MDQSREDVMLSFDRERLQRLDEYIKDYVDRNLMPNGAVMVFDKNTVHHRFKYGLASVESPTKEVEDDTIYRLYSMTKPVIAVAVLILHERGLINLDDPLHKFMPCFKDMQVATEGTYPSPDFKSEKAKNAITIQHLLTHTSGLTYWFFPDEHGVSAMYNANKVRFAPLVPGDLEGDTLQSVCERLASVPLLFEPGTQWRYSNSFDVLGRVIEIVSGKELDQFFKEDIFDVIGMTSTGFEVPKDKQDKFARCYKVKPKEEADGSSDLLTSSFVEGEYELLDNDSFFTSKPPVLSGGGGLVGTHEDYVIFCQTLLNKGVSPKTKKRLLGRKTVQYMMKNHLNGDMADYGMPEFINNNCHGVGFGLGGSVIISPQKTGSICSVGTYAWGGMSSVFFWIDPEEGLGCVFMTQLVPSSALPLRRKLRVLLYSALE